MRRRTNKAPVYLIAFGVGLIVAFYCPIKVLVFLLALALIYLGICCIRC
ncbi:MAG: hypothetical protein IJE01_05920 [Clostridia bacterium]|nr:hypothetical protein [Clostridia bacterium]